MEKNREPKNKSLNACVQLTATLWTGAWQSPLSMGFSRQEYWSGLPCPPPRDLPNPGIKPRSPTWQADSLQLCPTLFKTMDYRVHAILQARILEWVAIPSSRGSSQPRDWTQYLPHCGQIPYQLSHKGKPVISKNQTKPKIQSWITMQLNFQSCGPRVKIRRFVLFWVAWMGTHKKIQTTLGSWISKSCWASFASRKSPSSLTCAAYLFLTWKKL